MRPWGGSCWNPVGRGQVPARGPRIEVRQRWGVDNAPEPDDEAGAVWSVRLVPDFAAHAFDETFDDRESETRTLSTRAPLGLHERVEEMCDEFGGYTAAFVTDANGHVRV